jgi:hypothetical protein
VKWKLTSRGLENAYDIDEVIGAMVKTVENTRAVQDMNAQTTNASNKGARPHSLAFLCQCLLAVKVRFTTDVPPKQCKFPFSVDGVSYNGCVESGHEGAEWCQTDSKGDWGFCACEGAVPSPLTAMCPAMTALNMC